MDNGFRVAHGGSISTVFDMSTSVCVWCGGVNTGRSVSISLDCQYLKDVPVNAPVVIKSSCEKAGKNVLFLRGVIEDLEGNILVTCRHIKVGVPMPPGWADAMKSKL